MREWIERPGSREKKRASNKRWYEKKKAAGEVRTYNTEVHRFRRHGTTKEQFEELVASQGNRCAVCRRDGDWQTLCVDHDHECCPGTWSCGSCIRGALCKRCNGALGAFADSPEKLRAAAIYIESNRRASVL
mgnify:FL=1